MKRVLNKKIVSIMIGCLSLISLAGISMVVYANGEVTTEVEHTHAFIDGVCSICDLPGGGCGENVEWTFDEATGVLMISGSGEMEDYFYSSGPWKGYRSNISAVIISEGVTRIGDFAFYDCDNLTNVTISESVASIGDDVFRDCDNLTNIIVDENNPYYSSDGTGVLFDKEKTTLVLYLEGNSRTEYIIPNGVTSIGYKAFYYCRNLISVTLPDGVTDIGDLAFCYCRNLTSVTLPKSVINIGESAFCSCGSLTSVILPDGMATIGRQAFLSCRSLVSVTIPNSVTSIGELAFGDCDALSNIIVDESNQYYSSDGNGVLFDKDKTLLIQYPEGNSRTEYIIPDGVTSIGDGAFRDCEKIISVTIPDSVTSVGDRAFYWCVSLTSVILPKSATSIGEATFWGCSSLTSVMIPDGVTNIEMGTFAYCGSLTSITIPNSVRSIGLSAFSGCRNLTSITIPDSVRSIGSSAFAYCGSLTSITIPDSVRSIGSSVFYDCDNLTSVTIPDSVTSINSLTFGECSNLACVVLPKSVRSIEDFAFNNCDSLTDVYYTGTTASWSNISVESNNSCLSSAKIHYNCSCLHTIIVDDVLAPTCAEAGLSGEGYCSKCDKIVKAETVIDALGHNDKNVVTKATIKKNGQIVSTCTRCKKVKTTTIYYPKTIKLSATTYTYSGSVKKPSVTVKDSKGKTISSKYYTVTYASGRKNVGKYAVKITFKGNYSGSKTVYFTIEPKTTSISKVQAQKKGFKATWRKQSSQTTGYEIAYSTSSKFKSAKTKTISKNTTTSLKVSKLSAAKKYYVRVRTYKKVDGKTYYSDWSKAKTVTTKR